MIDPAGFGGLKKGTGQIGRKNEDNNNWTRYTLTLGKAILLYYSIMSKNSASLRLPRKVISNMQIVGQQIRLARKKRGLSIVEMAKRAQCSELTVMRIEKGNPAVSFGIYVRVLFGLGLDEDILLIARKDVVGDMYVNRKLLHTKQEEDYDVFD